jgi:uncharacterized protein YjiS (DUF1127 family)
MRISWTVMSCGVPIFTARHPKSRDRIASLRASFGHLLRRCVARISGWRRHGRDRRSLEHLDDEALRDLGIDRSLIENDSAVPFWRLH